MIMIILINDHDNDHGWLKVYILVTRYICDILFIFLSKISYTHTNTFSFSKRVHIFMNQRIVLSFLLKTVVSHSEETRSLKGLLQGAHAAWVPDRSSASSHALQELGPHSPSAAREPGTVS